MPSNQSGREIEVHSGSIVRVPAIEWSVADSAPPMILVADEVEPSAWAPYASRMAAEFRVLAIRPTQARDLLSTIWGAGEPAVVVAQGTAGEAACAVGRQSAGSFRALVLADFVPPPEFVDHRHLVIPTLVFHGRQSDDETHVMAVAVHEQIEGSRLAEPEDCGPWPAINCTDVFESAVRWFLQEPEGHLMDTAEAGEPVDPKSA